jgi:hypothetical protein
MDIESRVAPGEDLLRLLRMDEFFSDKKREELSVKELADQAIIESLDLMKDNSLIRTALGDEQMEMGVKNGGTEIAILPLGASLIFCDKSVEIVKSTR